MECGLGGLLVEGNAGVGGVVRLLWNTGLRTWQLAKVLYVQACVIRVHIQACTDFRSQESSDWFIFLDRKSPHIELIKLNCHSILSFHEGANLAVSELYLNSCPALCLFQFSKHLNTYQV